MKGTLTLLRTNNVMNALDEQKGINSNASLINKKNMSEQAKIKLKWKTIQYLLENKKRNLTIPLFTCSLDRDANE